MYKAYPAADKPVRTLALSERPPDSYPNRGRFQAEILSPSGQPKIIRQKVYPHDAPPKSIYLPYLPPDKDLGRYVETDSTGIGNHMRMVRSRRAKPVVPGWLIPLEKEFVNSIVSIKKVLGTMMDPCELVDELYEAISRDLKIVVTKEEIAKTLMSIPYDSEAGPSFGHFMYVMGNYSAGIKNMGKVYGNAIGCNDYKESEDKSGDSKAEVKSKGKKDSKKESPEPKKKTPVMYSLREKVFYSGLLIFEMYETLHGVEELYFGNWIPDPSVQDEYNPNAIGIRKKGIAEWDKPLPPLPKLSPYVSSMPFVTARTRIQKPNVDEKGRRRTMTIIQPMHMVIEPPRKEKQPIRITENRKRIRQALKFLAATGDCVALLPNIHFVIHLSDTFVERLEEVSFTPTTSTTARPKICYNNELAWIAREAKTLYRPHGIPPQIAKLKPLIKYTDGLNLRTICSHIRNQHWAYMSNRKLEFREEAWSRMHVQNIPTGALKDNFIYSFVTYLPFVSHLPIVHDQNTNPY